MNAPAAIAYGSDLEYLDDVLSLIALRLHREVRVTRALRGDQRQESFLGLFLSDEDLDCLLRELQGASPLDGLATGDLDTQIDSLRRFIGARVEETPHALPPQRLADLFGLDNTAVDLLIYLLAAEVDERFGRVYGYLHDDLGRRHMTLGLAYRLMRDGAPALASIRGLLHPAAPLLAYRLIEPPDEGQGLPLMGRPLRLEDRVADFLLGQQRVDAELHGLVEPHRPDPPFPPVLPEAALVELARDLRADPRPLVLEGGAGSDSEPWVAALASALGHSVLELDWRGLHGLEREQRLRLLVKSQREAVLTQALLHVNYLEAAEEAQLRELARLPPAPLCLSLHGSRDWPALGIDGLVLPVPPSPPEARQAQWDSALGQVAADRPAAERARLAAELGGRYPFGRQEVRSIARALADRRLLEPAGEVLEGQLVEACRRVAGRAMDGVAQRVRTEFRLADLVLPEAALGHLREVLLQQRHAGQVLETWGLGARFHQCRGNRVLFVGPSGTGKTMAASVLANELGLGLYRVDLAAVVSKYIGETEKNLDRVFNAASRSHVVLFIDEADALFGKRSEVKDAHDRYANIETSYLLQKMEDYAGIAVLATNLGQNLDEAFFRRIDSVIEFPLPQEADRLRLWQRMVQTPAPLAADVDLPFLARGFELSGGHIKNCILGAAYLAAEEAGAIGMDHLMLAVAREYLKIGKPISRATFGDYYPRLRRLL